MVLPRHLAIACRARDRSLSGHQPPELLGAARRPLRAVTARTWTTSPPATLRALRCSVATPMMTTTGGIRKVCRLATSTKRRPRHRRASCPLGAHRSRLAACADNPRRGQAPTPSAPWECVRLSRRSLLTRSRPCAAAGSRAYGCAAVGGARSGARRVETAARSKARAPSCTRSRPACSRVSWASRTRERRRR